MQQPRHRPMSRHMRKKMREMRRSCLHATRKKFCISGMSSYRIESHDGGLMAPEKDYSRKANLPMAQTSCSASKAGPKFPCTGSCSLPVVLFLHAYSEAWAVFMIANPA